MFRYDHPQQGVLLGDGAIMAIAAELRGLGAASVALITSPSGARSVGFVAVREQLHGLPIVHEYHEVRQHAPVAASDRLAARLRETAPDVLIAYGGGSVADTAKLAGLMHAHGGSLIDLRAHGDSGSESAYPRLDLSSGAPSLPLVCIPTTLSGAEVTAGGGATDERKKKWLFRHPALAARVVVYDPLALDGVPQQVVLSTGFNALAHCAEALYSRTASPVTDVFALEGVRTLATALPMYAQKRANDVASNLQFGAYLAGAAIMNARVGLHHAICHVLAPAVGLSHGLTNAILLPYSLAFNEPGSSRQQARLLGTLQAAGHGGPTAASAVRTLVDACGLPTALSQLGIDKPDFGSMAAQAVHEPSMRFNPVAVTDPTMLLGVLERAWDGRLSDPSV